MEALRVAAATAPPGTQSKEIERDFIHLLSATLFDNRWRIAVTSGSENEWPSNCLKKDGQH